MSNQSLSIKDLIANDQYDSDRIVQGAEHPIVRVGYLPLTDSAPILVASELGMDLKHGIKIVPTCESSWSAVRDHLISGDLDASQALYGMVHAIQAGISGIQYDLSLLLNLNWNGQAITLSNRLFNEGIDTGHRLSEYIRLNRGKRKLVFAQTFATGTHAMWLYYWFKSQNISLDDVDIVVIPPQQMVNHLKNGEIDGYSAGEPWNAMAIQANAGFTICTSQQIWEDHPEKVLACSKRFVEENPNTAKALMKAILEACQYLDDMKNREVILPLLCYESLLNLPQSIIRSRFLGVYKDGTGHVWKDPHAVLFHQNGKVNYPYYSDGLWFLNQFKQLGLLNQTHEESITQVKAVHWLSGYHEVAKELEISIPEQPYRINTLIDGMVWGDDLISTIIKS